MKKSRKIPFALLLFVMASCDRATIQPESSASSSSSQSSETVSYEDSVSSDSSISSIPEDFQLEIKADKTSLYIGEQATLSCDATFGELTYEVISGNGSIFTNLLQAKDEGEIKVQAHLYEFTSNILSFQVTRMDKDPYENVDLTSFYENYKPAVCNDDAYYRSLHYLPSGDIVVPDQAPSLASNQPKENGKFLKNISTYYFDNNNSYNIVNEKGEVVNTVYQAGAYITLEEVAGYIYAFNNIPKNYTSGKGTKPSASQWGKYLRVNHSSFSGDTSRYPYEPVLPNISGCGGTYQYYELDIGTTGTDCDPSYLPNIYNDGSRIDRGAARIVYARFDKDGKSIAFSDKHLFYTYNHYNDFQEYLNYQGGWGEIFGNITGGGKISSKTDCHPTSYVEVQNKHFNLPSFD